MLNEDCGGATLLLYEKNDLFSFTPGLNTPYSSALQLWRIQHESWKLAVINVVYHIVVLIWDVR